jgi:hypothetical protein
MTNDDCPMGHSLGTVQRDSDAAVRSHTPGTDGTLGTGGTTGRRPLPERRTHEIVECERVGAVALWRRSSLYNLSGFVERRWRGGSAATAWSSIDDQSEINSKQATRS